MARLPGCALWHTCLALSCAGLAGIGFGLGVIMRHPAAPEFDFRPAWRRDDAAIEADAIALWRRLGILPPDVAPEARARELAAAAYKDGELVGVMTATLQRIEFLRARFAMIRGVVDPAHRRGYAISALGGVTRDLVERWAEAHPEERVAGIGAVIETRAFDAFQKKPVWPNTRLAVAGYTPDGRQIRIAWFDHFRLD